MISISKYIAPHGNIRPRDWFSSRHTPKVNNPLDQLPPELIDQITSHLPPDDRVSLKRTSRYTYERLSAQINDYSKAVCREQDISKKAKGEQIAHFVNMEDYKNPITSIVIIKQKTTDRNFEEQKKIAEDQRMSWVRTFDDYTDRNPEVSTKFVQGMFISEIIPDGMSKRALNQAREFSVDLSRKLSEQFGETTIVQKQTMKSDGREKEQSTLFPYNVLIMNLKSSHHVRLFATALFRLT